jgi:hypothetical protein
MKVILFTAFLMLTQIISAQLFRYETSVNGISKFGFKDKEGRKIVLAKYDLVMPCSNIKNYWAVNIGADYPKSGSVKYGGKWGFIDSTGKEVIPIIYSSIGIDVFKGGLAAVKLNGQYGYINEKGETVIPFQFDDANSFDEDYAIVELNHKKGVVDKKGKIVIPTKYEEVKHDGFSEGLLAVKLNGKWGYVNQKNEVVVKFNYDYVESFSEGLSLVNKGGKFSAFAGCVGGMFGFIDKSGNVILKLIYENASSFKEGKATVTKDKTSYTIDKTGKEVAITNENTTSEKEAEKNNN